jgi:predicted nucleotidyltransferase
MEPRTVPHGQASARQTEMGERFNQVLFSALDALEARKIPYALIGGIAASGLGRPRSTHDIDVFVRPEDAEAALEALEKNGFDPERTDPRWLFKGWKEDQMVDIIFKSSGDIYFDNEMQERAKMIHYHGRDIPAVSPEDLTIIKAAVHEEVGPHHWHDALAILSHATLDWDYLLKRARRAPRRLLALLVYAQSNDIWIPNSVIQTLFQTIFGPQQESRPGQQAQSPAQHSQTPSGAQAARARRENRPKTRESENGKAIPDAYLIGHIQEALAAEARTAALDIRITVGGRKILIKGEVTSEDQRRAIEKVIRREAPDHDLDNQIRITEIKAPETEEVV